MTARIRKQFVMKLVSSEVVDEYKKRAYPLASRVFFITPLTSVCRRRLSRTSGSNTRQHSNASSAIGYAAQQHPAPPRPPPCAAAGHDEIWPEMAAMLSEHGVHNYSISLLPETLQLFAFAEIDSEERWAAIGSTAVCQRWWVHMATLMELEADGVRPKATGLREVFYLQ